MTTLARACGLPLEDWHRRGWRGGGLRIAHLDSGIDMDLPLFAGRLAGVLATGRAGDIRSREWVEDRTGHGTFTASLLCRIAPEARLLAAEVIEGGATLWRLMLGLDWAQRQGAGIALMPLGLPAGAAVLGAVLARLRSSGMLVIAAAGNTGRGRMTLPGALPEALSIGACDRDGGPARFSASSPAGLTPIRPDLLAHGVAIPGSGSGGAPERRSGTSVAAAVAAGAIAVLAGARSETVLEVAARLCAGAHPLPPDRRHRARYGRLDPAALPDPLPARPMPPVGPPPLCPVLEARLRHADAAARLDLVAAARPGTPLPRIPGAKTLPEIGAMRLRLSPAGLKALRHDHPALCLAPANPLTG